MNTSIVIEGILILVGVILIRPLWHRTFASRTARGLLIIAGLAIALVGLVPADVDENLHVLGALFITVCGNLGLLLVGFPSLAGSMRGLRILAVATGSIGLLATGLFFSGHFLGLGQGGMERFAVFNVFIWTFIVGCSLLTSSLRDGHRTGVESGVSTHDDQRKWAARRK